MGRLNKALSKRVWPAKKTPAGLSNSAAKALLDIKDSIKLPTSGQDSAPAPQADVVSFSKHLEKVRADTGVQHGLKKKNLKTVERLGKIVKIGKKEKMKMRRGMLVTKLTNVQTEEREVKAKKQREKVVIVKDIKPLMDDLEDIEKEIKQKDEHEKCLKLKKPKRSKCTQKNKKRKDQFMADLDFLKAAVAHPEYVKNPIGTVTLHLKNTIGAE